MFSNPILQTDADLQSFNTFGIAASARYYLPITEVGQLERLSQYPELTGVPRLILGGGSNVILTGDFPGVVIHMALKGRTPLGDDAHCNYVQAAAGENWHDFVQWTLAQGWGGLENLSLIPGSVGAAPIQNVGAYGVEIKDCLHALDWFEFATGKIHRMYAADCRFAYRDSVFKQALRDRGVIVNVIFALPKQWRPVLGYGDVAKALAEFAAPTPQQVSHAICALRQSKLPDPQQIGNVGSFFKNPLVSAELRSQLLQRFPALVSYPQTDGRFKLAAGWLIEQAGWKGHKCGPVGVYDKQALVLVNLGGASGADVTGLARAIRLDVHSKFGVELEVEPIFV